MTTTTGGG
ncbi:hypothetical protein ACHAW5_007121, partial [Stephanodiscus triporus]